MAGALHFKLHTHCEVQAVFLSITFAIRFSLHIHCKGMKLCAFMTHLLVLATCMYMHTCVWGHTQTLSLLATALTSIVADPGRAMRTCTVCTCTCRRTQYMYWQCMCHYLWLWRYSVQGCAPSSTRCLMGIFLIRGPIYTNRKYMYM